MTDRRNKSSSLAARHRAAKAGGDDVRVPFALVPIEAVLDDRLTKMQLRVLIALLTFREKNTDTVFPKREKLAARCRYSIDTISRVTSQLVELGWLTKDGRGGWSKASEYRVTVPDLELGFEEEAPAESAAVSGENKQSESEQLALGETPAKSAAVIAPAKPADSAGVVAPQTVAEPGNKTAASSAKVDGKSTPASSDSTTPAESAGLPRPVRPGAKNIPVTNHGTGNYYQAADTVRPFCITADWTPSHDVVELTAKRGVGRTFIEDALPEFILYWRSRPNVKRYAGAWDQSFAAHCRRQWERFRCTLDNDSTPRPIPADFVPNPQCMALLAAAGIPAEFVDGLVGEFVLYWRESREVRSSWNTVFLQRVKFRWTHSQAGTAETLLAKLTDRSWAYQADDAAPTEVGGELEVISEAGDAR